MRRIDQRLVLFVLLPLFGAGCGDDDSGSHDAADSADVVDDAAGPDADADTASDAAEDLVEEDGSGGDALEDVDAVEDVVEEAEAVEDPCLGAGQDSPVAVTVPETMTPIRVLRDGTEMQVRAPDPTGADPSVESVEIDADMTFSSADGDAWLLDAAGVGYRIELPIAGVPAPVASEPVHVRYVYRSTVSIVCSIVCLPREQVSRQLLVVTDPPDPEADPVSVLVLVGQDSRPALFDPAPASPSWSFVEDVPYTCHVESRYSLSITVADRTVTLPVGTGQVAALGDRCYRALHYWTRTFRTPDGGPCMDYALPFDTSFYAFHGR